MKDDSAPLSGANFIDLSSDTATRPSPAMRQAMAEAIVGDDQRAEDPTVNLLQEKTARLLGKELALFLPSATMANQIALKILTGPADQLICHEHAHIRLYEHGGPAMLSGLMLRPVPGARGILTPEQIHAAGLPDDPSFATTRLLCVENTHNYAGGCVWSVAETEAVARAAREHNLALHLDGSRILNAAVAIGCAPADLTSPFDTVTLCLSKGLGAPVGAILAGSSELITKARRWKHLFGGAMRQAGIIAAGGLYGIEHNIGQLAVDHANAAYLAEGLAEIPGVRLDPPPETNILYFDISGTGLTGVEAQARLLEAGVRCSGPYGSSDGKSRSRLRFVTHLDISRDNIEAALKIARRVFAS